MFYEFSQNNSGGTFVVNDKLDEMVIIEAESPVEANRRAELIGVYFDGDGDCRCCGNRWSSVWEDEKGTEVPSYYDEPIDLTEYRKAIIHYADGRVWRGRDVGKVVEQYTHRWEVASS
jgi:hypothetical protein